MQLFLRAQVQVQIIFVNSFLGFLHCGANNGMKEAENARKEKCSPTDNIVKRH